MGIKEKIKKIGTELGFDWVSIAPALPLEEERKHYQDWCAKGYAAELFYMLREYPRRWVPQDLLSEAKSAITFAVSYNSLFTHPVLTDTPLNRRGVERYGYGRVARYAWGKDYHIVIRKRLEEWVKLFSEAIGKKIKTKILVDSAPFLERAYANKGEGGFIGKNTLWISRKFGSFVFLAEILIDLDVEEDSPPHLSPLESKGITVVFPTGRDSDDSDGKPPHQLACSPLGALSSWCGGKSQDFNTDSWGGKDPCGLCKECLTACPTGALVNARELDAGKCISYWTIEHHGEISEEMRSHIGDWIFGCDICQEVCPYNGVPPETKWKEFLPESGTGPFLSLIEVLSLRTEEEFKKKFAETPILRAKRSGLVRNACVVCANQNFIEAIPLLNDLAKKDLDPVVRSHALWAVQKMAADASALRRS